MEERKHIVYAFVDENKKPFYVGRTYNIVKRNKEHLFEVKKGNTLPKYNKLRKLIKQGNDFKNLVIALETNIPSDLIEEKEIYYIAKLRQEGYKLKNLTDGGEGAINTIPGLSEKLKKIHTGKKRSSESKKRMSQARMGIVFSDEHKNNLSIAWEKRRKEKPTKIETTEKIKAALKGKANIKKYKLTDPEGKEYVTENGLTLFCEQHNLTRPNLMQVVSGKRTHHKGWTIKKI